MTKRAFLFAIALVLVAVAVNLPEPDSVPALGKPPKVNVVPTPSTMPDMSWRAIPAVSGTTTVPSVAIQGGSSAIRGRVTVDGAPAENATIRIDRFVGDKIKSIDIKSDKDGNYSLNNVVGGRYRVRAFRRPDVTMTTPQIIFLSANEQRSLNIALRRYTSGYVIASAIAPSPPYLGQTANVAVSVTSQNVDDSGTVRSSGQNGVVLQLQSDVGRSIVSANPVTTTGRGVAQWTIRCNSLTNQGLSVIFPDGTTQTVAVASCQPVPPPTTATTVAPSTGSASAVTPTTKVRGKSGKND